MGFKKYLFLLVLVHYFALGQTGFNGELVDSENNLPIAGAKIINTKTRDTIISNHNGTFKTSSFGTFLIKKKGYLSKKITRNNQESHLVVLIPVPSQLNEITITASQTPITLSRAPATVNIISKKDIDRAHHINFAETLNRIPGVYMQSGALNTNRITIRGVGSRNLFGTAKIRAYFKDIPLTNGSGETNIEDFELASLAKIEIIKGSISTIYGAGLGGTITLVPNQQTANQTELNSELSVGSFGLLKSVNSINHARKNHNLSLTHSVTESDGYRANNHYNKHTLTLHSNHSINSKNDLSLLASFVDLKAFIPSSLNETMFLNNPQAADTNWKNAKGFEDSKRGIFGLSWNHQLSTKTDIVSSVFLSFRNAYEPRPFNILEEETLAYGLRSRLVGRTKIFKKEVDYSFGGEIFRDTYNYKTFENLYEDYPENTGSVAGNQLSHFKEKRSYYNLFFEANYKLSKKSTCSIGANLNQTAYVLDDQFPVSEENPDQSGTFKFKNIISPKIGFSHLISQNVNIYGNISHGFSPISLNETLLPNGQINTSLKPETGWNFEIGSRGAIINNRLHYSISLYRLKIKNLLVSRRTAEDQFIGINAGQTQHDGLELSLNYQITQTETMSISTFCSHTLNHYIFKEFVDGDQNFSGNDLTGVPSHVFNAGIDMDFNFGIYGNINFQHVGKIPLTDSNNRYTDNYHLTNLKLGYRTNLNKNLKLNTFFGLNNIFDTAYASQVLINASSFGGNAPRYYYPGNPINYFSGFNVNYQF